MAQCTSLKLGKMREMNYTKINLPFTIKNEILAVGAESKSSFCFVRGNTAYHSEPGGDLNELRNFEIFERQIKTLQKKLKMKPKIIVCDLHPEYVSTNYALQMMDDGRRMTKIQHHEAHVASCMIDNNVKGKVIGIAFDGTGFGWDGNIWGGEFFVGDLKGLKRAGHLKYTPMPGGEACIREPWRMAFSYLYSIYKKGYRALNLPILTRLELGGLELMQQMMDKRINTPLTSSMGRLFDGVSALIGVCGVARYEGEAAIKLERIIKGKGNYKFKYSDEDGVIIINWQSVIKGIVKDLNKGISKPEISLKFHNAVCDMIKDVCNLLKKRYKIDKVCLSGGVFQNKYLKNNAGPILEKQGFKVYFHNRVLAHDGGIALGQAVLAGIL